MDGRPGHGPRPRGVHEDGLGHVQPEVARGVGEPHLVAEHPVLLRRRADDRRGTGLRPPLGEQADDVLVDGDDRVHALALAQGPHRREEAVRLGRGRRVASRSRAPGDRPPERPSPWAPMTLEARPSQGADRADAGGVSRPQDEDGGACSTVSSRSGARDGERLRTDGWRPPRRERRRATIVRGRMADHPCDGPRRADAVDAGGRDEHRHAAVGAGGPRPATARYRTTRRRGRRADGRAGW